MRRKYYCLVAIFFALLSHFGFGQRPAEAINGRLKGQVSDKETGTPLELVNIFLMKADTIKYGTITDKEGKFELKNIPLDTYMLSLRFLGYKSITIPLKLTERNQQAGVFQMQTDATLLEGVEVLGEDKNLIKKSISKTTLTVANSLRSTGTLKEVLDEAPQVTIDSDERISINGSTDVIVLLNGKRLQNTLALSILENVKAENIKSVEVISNPSAKYTSEGTGILNIVTKRTVETLVEVTGNAGTFPQAGGSVFLSFPLSQKTAFRTLYDYSYSKPDAFSDTQTLDLATSVFSRQIENREQELKAHFLSMEFDTQWNDKNNLQTGLYFLGNDLDINKQIDVITNSNGDEVFAARSSNSVFNVNNYDWQLGYTHYFENKTNWLNVDYNGTFGESEKLSSVLDRFENNEITLNNDFKDRRSVNEFELRYTNKTGKWNYEAGTNFRFRNFDYSSVTISNDNGFPSAAFTGAFDYSDVISSLFTDITRELPSKWNLSFGLRQEFTTIKLKVNDSNINRDQNNFFPYLSFSKSWPDNTSFDFSYRKKINRPKPNYLNPFFDLTDPSNIRLGNPDITSELIDEVNTSVTLRKKKLRFSVDGYYRKRKNPVQLIAEVSNDTTFVKYRNINKIEDIGGNLYSRISFSSALRTTMILNLNYTSLEDRGLGDENQGLNWSFRLRQNLNLKDIFDLQLAFNYYGPQNILQGKIEKITFFDLYVSRDILKKRGSVYLQWKDIFNTNEIRIVGVTADFDRDLFRNRETNTLIAGFQYTLFNGFKSKKRINEIKELYERDEYQ